LLSGLLNYIRWCITPPTSSGKQENDDAAAPMFQLHLHWLITMFEVHRLNLGVEQQVRSLLLMILKDLQVRKEFLQDVFHRTEAVSKYINDVLLMVPSKN